MNTIITIYGEKITGVIKQQDKYNTYIETYTPDSDIQEAITIFGKDSDYVKFLQEERINTIKIPNTDIKEIH